MRPFRLLLPDPAREIPLVLDSPHSGTDFPDKFETLASAAELRTAWDAHVDDLWTDAVTHGASLLTADFPRTVIDANRAPDDIDPALLSDRWPDTWGTLNPTRYSARGMGLVRRDILPGRPMYAAPLPPKQVRDWLTKYHSRYHAALAERLEWLQGRFGQVWHIDCHSMKSRANAMNIDAGRKRGDIVIGDVDGSSTEPGFSDCLAAAFESAGYSVAINDPYSGGYIVQRYGQPDQGVHSVQIEINRALYLDENTTEKSTNYAAFKADLSRIASATADYVRSRLEALA